MHILSTDDDNAPGCQILDGFAILVQLTLAMTALTALGIKRWRERPRRPVNVWYVEGRKRMQIHTFSYIQHTHTHIHH